MQNLKKRERKRKAAPGAGRMNWQWSVRERRKQGWLMGGRGRGGQLPRSHHALIAQYLIVLTWVSLVPAQGTAMHSHLAHNDCLSHFYCGPKHWDLGLEDNDLYAESQALLLSSLSLLKPPSCSLSAVLGPPGLNICAEIGPWLPEAPGHWRPQGKRKPGTHGEGLCLPCG